MALYHIQNCSIQSIDPHSKVVTLNIHERGHKYGMMDSHLEFKIIHRIVG